MTSVVTRNRLLCRKIEFVHPTLRWCGFIEARREGRTVFNRIADPRVMTMLDLAESLLADNAEHVAACCRIEEPRR